MSSKSEWINPSDRQELIFRCNLISSATQCTVLQVISWHMMRGNKAFPSYETISSLAHTSRRTAIRIVDQLVARGLLQKEITTRSNNYSIDWELILDNQSDRGHAKSKLDRKPVTGRHARGEGAAPEECQDDTIERSPSDTLSPADSDKVTPASDKVTPASDKVSPAIVTACHPKGKRKGEKEGEKEREIPEREKTATSESSNYEENQNQRAEDEDTSELEALLSEVTEENSNYGDNQNPREEADEDESIKEKKLQSLLLDIRRNDYEPSSLVCFTRIIESKLDMQKSTNLDYSEVRERLLELDSLVTADELLAAIKRILEYGYNGDGLRHRKWVILLEDSLWESLIQVAHQNTFNNLKRSDLSRFNPQLPLQSLKDFILREKPDTPLNRRGIIEAGELIRIRQNEEFKERQAKQKALREQIAARRAQEQAGQEEREAEVSKSLSEIAKACKERYLTVKN